MNHHNARRAAIALAWIALAVPLSARNDMRGHWSGSIETSGGALAMEVDLDHAASGWIGSVSIPAQGATGGRWTQSRSRTARARFTSKEFPAIPRSRVRSPRTERRWTGLSPKDRRPCR